MADRMQTAGDRLNARLKSRASQTITYSRGAHSVQLLASISEKEYAEVDTQDVAIAMQSTDFLCEAIDLVINGSVVLPTNGDLITTAEGNTYIVVPVGGEQEYRLVYGRLRIHTKQR